MCTFYFSSFCRIWNTSHTHRGKSCMARYIYMCVYIHTHMCLIYEGEFTYLLPHHTIIIYGYNFFLISHYSRVFWEGLLSSKAFCCFCEDQSPNAQKPMWTPGGCHSLMVTLAQIIETGDTQRRDCVVTDRGVEGNHGNWKSRWGKDRGNCFPKYNPGSSVTSVSQELVRNTDLRG